MASTTRCSSSQHPFRYLSTRVVALLSLCALTYYAVFYVTNTDTLDLQIYLESAQRLRDGQSLYQARYIFPEQASDLELQYLYPPALAALLAEVSIIPRPMLMILWQCGLVASISMSALLLAALVQTIEPGRKSYLSFYAVFPLLAFWPPTLVGILWGQVNAYVLLLLVCAAYCAARGRFSASGMAVGIAAALKGAPIILALPLLVHRRWKALGSCMAALIAMHLPLLTFPKGVESLHEFLLAMRAIASGQVVNDPNYDYSMRRVVALFADLPAGDLSSLLPLLGLLYLGVTAWQRRQGAAVPGGSERLCAAQILSAVPIMMLVSPLLWFHHLIWLFPVLFFVHQAAVDRSVRWLVFGLYVVLAPLLYVHVYFRHFTSAPEWVIKPLPLLITGVSYVLVACIISRVFKDSKHLAHTVPQSPKPS